MVSSSRAVLSALPSQAAMSPAPTNTCGTPGGEGGGLFTTGGWVGDGCDVGPERLLPPQPASVRHASSTPAWRRISIPQHQRKLEAAAGKRGNRLSEQWGLQGADVLVVIHRVEQIEELEAGFETGPAHRLVFGERQIDDPVRTGLRSVARARPCVVLCG